jgi:hypothetical protein
MDAIRRLRFSSTIHMTLFLRQRSSSPHVTKNLKSFKPKSSCHRVKQVGLVCHTDNVGSLWFPVQQSAPGIRCGLANSHVVRSRS